MKGDPREIFRIGKTIKKLDSQNRESFDIIKNLSNTGFDMRTIANPIFLEDYQYLQDKVITADTFLRNNKEMFIFIDRYIEQIKYFWSYGFADRVFNFTLNNGINENGDIVLFDFNEITANINDISSDIGRQKWITQHSNKFHLNSLQKQYFKKRMEEEITITNLNKTWKSKIKTA